ncbi:hypothetical protein G4177_22670 [Corallococcus sp. ZKHCc1 1396]|uniref:Cytochrome c-552/4 domain-containing protein n=1 Tax=Corallococcus soli TaxID=2710757 RepID=A0ABR9PSS5_9BACT|nr:hypothetical protein [Corallococcus soli]MBE4750980.1 hypothetical protein [Corallococcus soli]
MKTNRQRYLLLALGGASALTVAVALVGQRGGDSQGTGSTRPPPLSEDASGAQVTSVPTPGTVPTPYPVFPRGNKLTQPLDEDDIQAQQFLAFYGKQGGVTFPALTKASLQGLPNRTLDIAHNGLDLGSQRFNTSLVCQSCHDADWLANSDITLPPGTLKTYKPLPTLAFWQMPTVDTFWNANTQPSFLNPDAPLPLAANWSPFGDWSASVKALAGRDPIFLAQVETTRKLSPHQPTTVDNLCLRCHSPLGQRQAQSQHKPFTHDLLYATPANSTQDPERAVLGALGRDGVSCSACHSVAPSSGQPWNGTDYTAFYGTQEGTIFGDDVASRLKQRDETVQPPPFPFTSSMNLRPGTIVGPDTHLNKQPMAAAGLSLETAATVGGHSYLRDSMVCGSCHVVILPKVPTNYRPSMPIAEAEAQGVYKRPASCAQGQTTFSPTGDFLTDPCVELAYEQTTYFEWLNSGYAQSTSTCMTCHMQITSPDSPFDGSVKVAQQNPDLAAFYRDNTALPPRQYNRHTLLGINLFVHEMFQQFPDVLGLDFYAQPDSRVPPYLQSPEILARTPNLVTNPGAEDGPKADGWVPDSGATVTVVTQQQGMAQQAIRPSHGAQFFQLSGGAALTVDVSSYQDLIDRAAGAATVQWGATVYCDGVAPCGTLSLQQQAGQGAWTNTAGATPVTATQQRWLSVHAASPTPIPAGTRALRLAFQPGRALSVDDVFLALKFPDGSVKPLTDGKRDYTFAKNLLNAEQSILDLAVNTSQGVFDPTQPAVLVSLGQYKEGSGLLSVPVTVTSNVGHKFPSGAGFRRAFLQFEVRDAADKVLWASGQPNPLGVICNGVCKPDDSALLASEFTTDTSQLQPNHQVITRQDQAQVYELRAVDDMNRLTSLELQQFKEVKDNRLLPEGWISPAQRKSDEMLLGLNLKQLASLTEPFSLVLGTNDTSVSGDPDFNTSPAKGVDQLVYQVPLSAVSGWKSIRVRMNYQTIPPFYLNARFRDSLRDDKGQPSQPGPAVQRLIYMTSHLNTKTSLKYPAQGQDGQQVDLMDNWSMVLSEARVTKN